MDPVVDENLLFSGDSRPLRYLFLDLNSYFASVEQQVRPELRGRPVAVVPMMVDTACVLASSYEAKAFGVKTGTLIGDAKAKCPGIELVLARHALYTCFHNRIIEAAESVLPVDKVKSIDEMQFKLIGKERNPEEAIKIAQKMKQTIRGLVGENMTCSVGIAPNAFLAKLATELQKPDGLVVLEAKDLPGRLLRFKLTDFTGINRKMEVRLNASGIFTAADLYSAGPKELAAAFGSVVGERWWHLLRGFEIDLPDSRQKSLGNSHILPPEHRNEKGCREVLLRLIQKASMRLRDEGLCAGSMTVYVRGRRRGWQAAARLDSTNDTIAFNEAFHELWKDRDFSDPFGVGLTFHDLVPAMGITPSLFDESNDRSQFNEAVDRLNRKFGKNTVYLAGMAQARNTAEERIAFGKTKLLCEGKNDNMWNDEAL